MNSDIKKFKGRIIVSGIATGEAVVTRKGFNSIAIYKSARLKNGKHAYASDQNNEDLYKKQIDGKIICLPQMTGSTSAGIVNTTAAMMDFEPKAYLFSKTIDTLGAAGAVFTRNWTDKKVIYIDELGDDFLNYVKDDMIIEIKEDGTVIMD